jgi:hypothetical protein
MPDITKMDLIMTVPHGYVHPKEADMELQGIFYPGLTPPLY